MVTVTWNQFVRHGAAAQEELTSLVHSNRASREGHYTLLIAKQLPEEFKSARKTLTKLWEEYCMEHILICENPSVAILQIKKERLEQYFQTHAYQLKPYFYSSMFEPGIGVEFFPFYPEEGTPPSVFIIFLHT
jgi:hypothetical protein